MNKIRVKLTKEQQDLLEMHDTKRYADDTVEYTLHARFVHTPNSDVFVQEMLFLNGFTSWYETFYEVVAKITYILHTDLRETCRILKDITNMRGRGGLYDLAYELTQNFENYYQGKVWDGDYFDTIDKFLEKELI